MIWARAIAAGFWKGDGKVLGSALLFGSTWLFATLALRPVNRGLHEAFDGAPAAQDLLAGRGLDLWAEMGIRQPALFSAGFSLFLPLLLLSLAAGLYLTAGVYGQAASPAKPAWRTFFWRANRFTPPFAAGLFLNALAWGALFALFALALLGLGHAFEDSTDPGVAWRMVLLDLSAAALLVELFRSSVGFFQARYALTGGREGIGRCFLRALRFALRKLVPVLSMTVFFTLLKLLALWLALFALSPGYATTGRWFLTALVLQGGYFAVAFLRVAEARSQVEYAKAFLDGAEGRMLQVCPVAAEAAAETPGVQTEPPSGLGSEDPPAAQGSSAGAVDSAFGGA